MPPKKLLRLQGYLLPLLLQMNRNLQEYKHQEQGWLVKDQISTWKWVTGPEGLANGGGTLLDCSK
jgi:hypothetical protein